MRLHEDTCCRIKLYQLVFTCRRQRVSCIGDKIVASLLPVCCWIQRDTSRPWHKWIVIMSPRYSLHVSRTSSLYPASCIRRHICIWIQIARPGHMFPSDMCTGVNAALVTINACRELISPFHRSVNQSRCFYLPVVQKLTSSQFNRTHRYRTKKII